MSTEQDPGRMRTIARHRRAALTLACAIATAAAVACTAAGTAPCGGEAAAAGTWRFVETRDSPDRATATGTLVLRARSCGVLDGMLDVVETDASGRSRRVAGPVTGSAPDAESVRFEIVADGLTLHHAGIVRDDSLTGSWAALAGSTPTGSGRFRAARDGAHVARAGQR
jgi:hypothetical protein